MFKGGSEFSGETAGDSTFSSPGVVYFASAGDSPGTLWPGASPNVVSAGGTTPARNPASGSFLRELPWDSAGGGVSPYESRPSYQNAIKAIVGAGRGVPDLSADSNPVTGVWVLDNFGGCSPSSPPCWYIVGGTSVATATLAGIVNSAGHFAPSSAIELGTIYAKRAVKADFHDLTMGFCGPTRAMQPRPAGTSAPASAAITATAESNSGRWSKAAIAAIVARPG